MSLQAFTLDELITLGPLALECFSAGEDGRTA